MLKHIVFFKFKEGTSDQEIDDIVRDLRNLKNKISQIHEIECGRDILKSERSFDMALTVVLEDLSALDQYQVHQDHQAVVAKVKLVAESIKAVDYII